MSMERYTANGGCAQHDEPCCLISDHLVNARNPVLHLAHTHEIGQAHVIVPQHVAHLLNFSFTPGITVLISFYGICGTFDMLLL